MFNEFDQCGPEGTKYFDIVIQQIFVIGYNEYCLNTSTGSHKFTILCDPEGFDEGILKHEKEYWEQDCDPASKNQTAYNYYTPKDEFLSGVLSHPFCVNNYWWTTSAFAPIPDSLPMNGDEQSYTVSFTGDAGKIHDLIAFIDENTCLGDYIDDNNDEQECSE